MKYIKILKKSLGLNNITKSELSDLMIDFDYYYKWEILDDSPLFTNRLIIYSEDKTIDSEKIKLLLKDVQDRLSLRGIRSDIISSGKAFPNKGMDLENDFKMLIYKNLYGEFVVLELYCSIKN